MKHHHGDVLSCRPDSTGGARNSRTAARTRTTGMAASWLRLLAASILASGVSAGGSPWSASASASSWPTALFGSEPAVPRASLSPPPPSSSFSTAFSSSGRAGPLTARASLAADVESTSSGFDGYLPSGPSSEGLEPTALDVLPEARPAAPTRRPRPQPQGVSALAPRSQPISHGQIVALAEGAAKLLARSLRAFSTSASETVRFDLFTRQQPAAPTRILARRRETLERSAFDPAKPTKLIIHGFLSHQGPSSGGDALKNAFLSAQDCNVITVDWSGADPLEYNAAVRVAVPRVAAEVAALMSVLRARGASLDDMHVVGHSLGGQIAGAVGSLTLGPAAAGRITALDPAGPLFVGKDPSHRLDPTDAAFVDVIHTDGGHLGYAAPTGHADFYPQGGMHKHPACGKDVVGICSHCVAYDYLIDAVLRPGSSVFRSCSSWQAYRNGECQAGGNAVLGIFTDPRSRGSFFLSSNMPVREELRKAGEKDIVGLLSIRSTSGGRDGVMVLQC